MKLVVFDIDGTLTANNTLSNIAFQQTVKECYGIIDYNKTWHEYAVSSDVGIIREICRRNNINISWSEILKFQLRYFDNFKNLSKKIDLASIDGAVEFINRLYFGRKHAVLIITGGFPIVAREKLLRLGIFDEIPCSTAFDGLSRDEILLTGINKAKCIYNCDFENYMLFGDSITDINLAKKRNMLMVGITSSLTSQFFLDNGVFYSIKSFHDKVLQELFRKWQ